MNNHIRKVIGKVLKAAANSPNFFDLSDCERQNFMIAQAYLLGQLAAARSARAAHGRTRVGRKEGMP